eukprot:5318143-Pyramimonas_sp.AAC.1
MSRCAFETQVTRCLYRAFHLCINGTTVQYVTTRRSPVGPPREHVAVQAQELSLERLFASAPRLYVPSSAIRNNTRVGL